MKKRSFDKKIVRSSFVNTANYAVRLASFGGAIERVGTDEGLYFENIGEDQAHDDLVAMSISARRLAEVAACKSHASKQRIAQLLPLQVTPTKWEIKPTGKSTNLLDLYSRILHSKLFMIVSNDYELKFLRGKLASDIGDRYQEAKFRTHFKPLALLRSDKSPLLMCGIQEIAKKTMMFLDHVSDDLSEDGFWIGNHDMSFD